MGKTVKKHSVCSFKFYTNQETDRTLKVKFNLLHITRFHKMMTFTNESMVYQFLAFQRNCFCPTPRVFVKPMDVINFLYFVMKIS